MRIRSPPHTHTFFLIKLKLKIFINSLSYDKILMKIIFFDYFSYYFYIMLYDANGSLDIFGSSLKHSLIWLDEWNINGI